MQEIAAGIPCPLSAYAFPGDAMKKTFSIGLVLGFAALLLVHPETASAAVRDGLALCARTVVPSLFPFFVVTALLLQSGLDSLLRPICAPFMVPLFRLRGECAAPLLAGFLGGYPAGARSAAQLYEQGGISRGEAERLLGFCNNCGPGFMIGFVGTGVLGSTRAGAALLAVHIAAALVSGAILCRLPGGSEPPRLPCSLPAQNASFPKALTTSVSGALSSTLGICAYVVFFRTAAALLPSVLPAAVLGVVEMVSGIAGLSPNTAGFVAAAGITAWGGISVHCQTMAVAGELSLRYHVMGKILQTVLSVVFAVVIVNAVGGRVL